MTKTYLTKKERENPVGDLQYAMSSQQIVEKLQEIDFLTDDNKLTRRGNEYVRHVLPQMDNVQRIMIEHFILEYHQANVNVGYDD